MKPSKLTPKQITALESPASEVMYGGAAGGGKSWLLRIMAIVYASLIPGCQVYIFRRLSEDLKANHLYGESGLLVMLSGLINAGKVTVNEQQGMVKFDHGDEATSTIYLRHCQFDKDAYKYDGVEIHLLLIDELTHFSEFIYRFLRGRVRVSKELDTKGYSLPRVVSGTNPGNVGHNWVRRSFVRGTRPLEVRQMPDEEGGMTRQFIPAFLEDNPHLDQKAYAANLSGLGDPALVKAKLKGDWDIVSGGYFDDLLNLESQDKIMISPFSIPSSWPVNRSFDWGSSAPFSVCWWAEANGEDAIMSDGSARSFPRGTLFLIYEWYGANEKDEGLRMLASDIAKGIKERESFFAFKVKPGPADSSIYNTENGMCIADDMAAEGIKWTPADKRPGSRVNGWQLMRSMFGASLQHPMESPGLFAFNHCRHFWDQIPILPRDDKHPEDIDSASLDHIADAVRYRVTMPRHHGTIGKVAAQ